MFFAVLKLLPIILLEKEPQCSPLKSKKFSFTTTSNSNFNRVLQYSSQLVWWYLERRGFSTDYIEQLKQLQSSLSLARKCKITSMLFLSYNRLSHSLENVR